MSISSPSKLSLLAYFTHCISVLLLNCVEVSSQDELLNIFPRLYPVADQTVLGPLGRFIGWGPRILLFTMYLYQNLYILRPSLLPEKTHDS